MFGPVHGEMHFPATKNRRYCLGKAEGERKERIKKGEAKGEAMGEGNGRKRTVTVDRKCR
jgi:hypothetical protein